MTRSFKIKVCGLRDNIGEVVELQPDYIGMIFYKKSPRFVGEDFDLPEIGHAVKKVGVFVNASLEYMLEKAEKYNLDLVQLHGSESPALCEQVRSRGICVIKAFAVDGQLDFDTLSGYLNATDFFLFDTKTPKHGGSGKQFDWNLLTKYQWDHPYFLSGGIGPEDIQSLAELSLKNLHAIDVNSRVELEPGLKDVGKVAQMLNQ